MLQVVMLNVELFNFILRLRICLYPAAGQRSAAPTNYLQLFRFNICFYIQNQQYPDILRQAKGLAPLLFIYNYPDLTFVFILRINICPQHRVAMPSKACFILSTLMIVKSDGGTDGGVETASLTAAVAEESMTWLKIYI